MPLPPVRAVIFDLDGTLADSLDDIARALTAALVDHGLPAPARDDVRGWVGGGARELVARAIANARTAPLELIYARFQHHYAAAPAAHTRLYPGVAAMLDRLVVAQRTLAVLTNKPHALATRICAELLAAWPFAIIAGQRAAIPIKPDPTPALMIANELGVPADSCALVGDAPSDVATARAAGMCAVAVTWGYRSRAELIAAQPDLVVDTPAELA